MFVYLPNTATHTMYVCPAGDVEAMKGEAPSEFKNDDGTARSFTVQFTHGRADVPDNLGNYMIKRKLARKTKLLLPGD